MSENMNQEWSLMPAEEFLFFAWSIGALTFHPEGYTLKSGRTSPYFFNSGLFNDGRRLKVLSLGYADVIAQHFTFSRSVHQQGRFLACDLLYGPPYKGTILVPAIALQLYKVGFEDTYFCTSRKEEKTHGEGGMVIGAPIKPGDIALIVDDVITDGGTKREAVELIQKHGGTVAGLVIAFDRQERGAGTESAAQEFSREYNVPVHAIATLADLISLVEKRDDFAKIRKPLIAYRQQYGVVS